MRPIHPRFSHGASALLCLGFACSEPSNDTDDNIAVQEPTGVDSSPAESTDAGDEDTFDCDESDLSTIYPLSGPGVAPDGALMALEQDEYVLHSTLLVIKPGKRDEAFQLAVSVIGAMSTLPGFVAATAAESERCKTMRTRGIWRDEGSMYQLLSTPEHVDAVRKTFVVGDAGWTTHWAATADEASTFDWTVAMERVLDVPPYRQ